MAVVHLEEDGHVLDLGKGNGGQPPLDVGDVLAGVIAQRAGQIVLAETQLGAPNLDEFADDLAQGASPIGPRRWGRRVNLGFPVAEVKPIA